MTRKVLVFLLTIALLATGAAMAEGLSVTDMTGRAVSLDAPAAQIVALTANDVEILYAIGAGDTLVGRGEYCDYPEQALEIPAVQSGAETNLEQIIALKPQLVIMGKMAQTTDQEDALEAAGIPVVVTDANDIEGTYENIRLLGVLTGKTDEAEAVVNGMQARFDAVRAKVGEQTPGKTVYFEVSPLQYGLWTTGKGTFMDEIAGMLGVDNIFADVDGWASVSEEQVIDRNPDLIVTTSMYFGEGPTPTEEIASRAGWQDMTAVKNGALFNANSNEVTRPGPRLADAAEALYAFVYGE